MSGWTAKRFWKAASVEEIPDGHAVRLDGRPVKTPAKAALVLPTRAMAEAVAAEWDAQTGVVKPASMPVTRAANSAIDKVAVQFDEVAGLLCAYGGSDLLCYRAMGPAALIRRQEAAWDPLLHWSSEALGAPLHATRGVAYVDQPEQSLSRLSARITALTPFQLAAVHDLIAISGSLVLALAVIDRRLSLDAAWVISRVDETWQAEQWGEDEDAAAQEALRRQGFEQAGRFFALCG